MAARASGKGHSEGAPVSCLYRIRCVSSDTLHHVIVADHTYVQARSQVSGQPSHQLFIMRPADGNDYSSGYSICFISNTRSDIR